MQPVSPLRRILTGLAATLTLGIITTPASGQEMISNGSFEVGKAIPLNWNNGAGGYTQVNIQALRP